MFLVAIFILLLLSNDCFGKELDTSGYKPVENLENLDINLGWCFFNLDEINKTIVGEKFPKIKNNSEIIGLSFHRRTNYFKSNNFINWFENHLYWGPSYWTNLSNLGSTPFRDAQNGSFISFYSFGFDLCYENNLIGDFYLDVLFSLMETKYKIHLIKRSKDDMSLNEYIKFNDSKNYEFSTFNLSTDFGIEISYKYKVEEIIDGTSIIKKSGVISAGIIYSYSFLDYPLRDDTGVGLNLKSDFPKGFKVYFRFGIESYKKLLFKD